MSLFTRKETIVLKNEQQRDAFIDKLEKAHVEYKYTEEKDAIYTRDINYVIQLKASDLKKVS